MSQLAKELRVEDALMYLDQVKMEFGDRPHVYNEFLDIMKNFKSQEIDTPGVIERVSNLFHGNKRLVLGFNTFLPEGYKIELQMDGGPAVYRAPGRAGVTAIPGRGAQALAQPPPVPAPAVSAGGPHGGPPHVAPHNAAAAAAGRGGGWHGHAPPQHGGAMIHPSQQQHGHPHGGGGGRGRIPPNAGVHNPRHGDPQAAVHGQPQGKAPSLEEAQRSAPPPHWQAQAPGSAGRPQPMPPSAAGAGKVAGQPPQQPNVSVSDRARLAAAEQQGREIAERTQQMQHVAMTSQLPGQRGGGPGGGGAPAQPTQPQLAPSQQAPQGGPHHPPSGVQAGQPPQQQGPGGGPGVAPAAQQQQQQDPAAPVEFDHAINYVTTIKKRFSNAPDTYKNFLRILHTYQREQRGIKEVLDEVSDLFADHPDLLREFTYFLPDAVQAQAKAQLETVARAAIDRKVRAAQEAAKNVAAARTDAIMRAKMAAKEQKRQAAAAAAQQAGQGGAPQGPRGSYQPPPSAASSAATAAAVAAAVPQPPPPPPIPFGAMRGRTEERERELCRTAIYGQVSFAPVRPPRKGDHTAEQEAIKFGRPRAVPEPPVQPNAREAQFFHRAREHLNRRELAPDKPAGSRRHTPHAEFLKCLHLFGAGILSREEILLLLRTLFMQGHAPKTGPNSGGAASNPKLAAEANELMEEFEAILIGRGPYANQQQAAKDRSKYGSLPLRLCDFSRSDNPTPSYRTYPADHPHKKFSHSGQSKKDASALNNSVACVGSTLMSDGRPQRYAIEGYDGPKARRNMYEEALVKVEEERFEMDMAIERNFSAMRQVEPLAEEVTALRIQEERDGQPIGRMQYKLRQRSLGANHIGAIARLYGDSGDTVVRYLAKNPIAVLPIVSKRLKEKDGEWRVVRTEWSKKWKATTEENFDGSLDVTCYFYRRELEKMFAPERLLEECKKAKHWTKKTNAEEMPEQLCSISPTFGLEHDDARIGLFQPFVRVKASTDLPHKDAHQLVSAQVLKLMRGKAEKERISRLWSEFVVPLFDLPAYWLSEDLRSCSQPEESSATVAYAVGQRVRTACGDGLITCTSLVSGSIKYRVKLDYGIAFVQQSSIIHSLPASPGSDACFARDGNRMVKAHNPLNQGDRGKPVEGRVIFGTEKMYLFLRTYSMLVLILDEARHALTCLRTAEKRTDAEETGTTSKSGSPEKMDIDEKEQNSRTSESKKAEQDALGYGRLLSSIQAYVSGKLAPKAFETQCRSLWREGVYKLTLLPKLAERCAYTMQKVAREDVCLRLSDASQMGMGIAQQRTHSLGISKDAVYRVQFADFLNSLFFSYLPVETDVLLCPRVKRSHDAGGAIKGTGTTKAAESNVLPDGDVVRDDEEEPSSKRPKFK